MFSNVTVYSLGANVAQFIAIVTLSILLYQSSCNTKDVEFIEARLKANRDSLQVLATKLNVDSVIMHNLASSLERAEAKLDSQAKNLKEYEKTLQILSTNYVRNYSAPTLQIDTLSKSELDSLFKLR